MSTPGRARLDTKETFAELTFKSITGYDYLLPKEFKDSWSLVLLYRGGW